MSDSANAAATLFLLGTLEIGGSETKFVGLANRLFAAGFPVHIAYLREPDALLQRIEGVPTAHLKRGGRWSLRAYRNLSRHIAQHRIKTIVTVNPYPLIYAVPFKLLNPGLAIRVVASINTSEILSARERRFMGLYQWLLNRCDEVVFGSELQKAHWLQQYGISPGIATVTYNGVDAKRFCRDEDLSTRNEVRNQFDIPDDAVVVACVSQLRPEKAHVNLLQAFGKLAQRQINPYLMLVGDGTERDKLERESRNLGLQDRTIFSGAVSDVRPYLRAADIFALTSIAVETFSNAALEASAMGLPVIISDVGGAIEMFPDTEIAGERGGIVYPRDDIDSLVNGLAETIARVQEGAIDAGKLRARVLAKFSLEAMDAGWKKSINYV